MVKILLEKRKRMVPQQMMTPLVWKRNEVLEIRARPVAMMRPSRMVLVKILLPKRKMMVLPQMTTTLVWKRKKVKEKGQRVTRMKPTERDTTLTRTGHQPLVLCPACLSLRPHPPSPSSLFCPLPTPP